MLLLLLLLIWELLVDEDGVDAANEEAAPLWWWREKRFEEVEFFFSFVSLAAPPSMLHRKGTFSLFLSLFQLDTTNSTHLDHSDLKPPTETAASA